MRPVPSWAPPEDSFEPSRMVDARPPRGRFPILNLVLFGVTLVTTTMAGALNHGVPPDRLSRDWSEGLPFSLTLMAILAAHEMGHYALARWHGVRVTLPFFLPGPPFLTGTFGAFIRMRSQPGSRRELFDVGAAGPWAGLFVTLPAVLCGLVLSELKPIPPTYGGINFGDSLLFKGVAWMVFGPIPYGYDIVLHPVALAGWFGLFVTVLNLLPVGQLDGGHVVYAMFGGRHRWIARTFLVITVVVGFFGWPGWFLWAVLMLFVGLDHPPTTDRVTELDPLRRLFGWLTIAVFFLIFIPVPLSWIEGGMGPTPDELVPVSYSVPG